MKKVVVALSGGVDSSVAAALLKRDGFNVVGIFMKFWKQDGGKNRCCTPESEKRARLVTKTLNIPFYTLNLEKEFKKKIVDYFLKAEKQGLTPNPCVVCNKEIKFGLLLDKAFKLGADFVATGHYCQTDGRSLFKGKDKEKDQSYFLWQVDKKKLKHLLFPVGKYLKPEVRKLAEKFKLPTAKTPESQEVCFIGDSLNRFLLKYLKEKKGNIVSGKKIIGEHKGLWFYTIGQRKGIGLASEKPYYVLRKDIKKNELIVTQDEKELISKEAKLINVVWVNKPKTNIEVKIRYRSKVVKAIVKGKTIRFSKPQRAVTPGQSAVFYKGDKLVGGGILA